MCFFSSIAVKRAALLRSASYGTRRKKIERRRRRGRVRLGKRTHRGFKMPKVVVAVYTLQTVFMVPDDFEIKEGNHGVKWNKLYIYNDKGEETEIQPIDGFDQSEGFDFKRPDDIIIREAEDYEIEAAKDEDDDSEEEEEEETTHVCNTCDKEMSHERFEKGKMCCDKPEFNDKEDEGDDLEFLCDDCVEQMLETTGDVNYDVLCDDCCEQLIEQRREKEERSA